MNCMDRFIQHCISEMDNNGMQRCIVCGEILTYYSGIMAPVGSQALRGFDPGVIYVSLGQQPRIMTTIEPENAAIYSCFDKAHS